MASSETLEGHAAGRALAGKYLTFGLGRESYGIEVTHIREIIRLTDITSVPHMPDFIRGVINLRGKIIPVLDLRLRFGLPQAEATERTCIIVVQITSASGVKTHMGLIVDRVEEVTNIAQADIQETPDFGIKLESNYILAMAKVRGAVKTLLDIGHVLASDTIEAVHHAANP